MTAPKMLYFQEWKDGVHLRDITPREFWCLSDEIMGQYEYYEAWGSPVRSVHRNFVTGTLEPRA